MERTSHDSKGNFVVHLRVNGFSKKETAEIADWSEDDVECIERKYASGDRIAQGWLARFAERSKTD